MIIGHEKHVGFRNRITGKMTPITWESRQLFAVGSIGSGLKELMLQIALAAAKCDKPQAVILVECDGDKQYLKQLLKNKSVREQRGAHHCVLWDAEFGLDDGSHNDIDPVTIVVRSNRVPCLDLDDVILANGVLGVLMPALNRHKDGDGVFERTMNKLSKDIDVAITNGASAPIVLIQAQDGPNGERALLKAIQLLATHARVAVTLGNSTRAAHVYGPAPKDASIFYGYGSFDPPLVSWLRGSPHIEWKQIPDGEGYYTERDDAVPRLCQMIYDPCNGEYDTIGYHGERTWEKPRPTTS